MLSVPTDYDATAEELPTPEKLVPGMLRVTAINYRQSADHVEQLATLMASQQGSDSPMAELHRRFAHAYRLAADQLSAMADSCGASQPE